MRLQVVLAVAVVFLSAYSSALAQETESMSGHVEGWTDGEAQVVLVNGSDWPPAMTMRSDALVVGSVSADGELQFTLPPSMPDEEFVPVGEFLDPGCEDLTQSPEDARYFPMELIAYSPEGNVIGAVFLVNPGGGSGPVPGGYSVLMGYSTQSFTLRGSCPQAGRPVVEAYDLAVEPGWHTMIQRFSEHSEDPRIRVDTWVNEDIPEDAVWIIDRPR